MKCPKCNGTNMKLVNLGNTTTDMMNVISFVRCLDCKENFHASYVLIHVYKPKEEQIKFNPDYELKLEIPKGTPKRNKMERL